MTIHFLGIHVTVHRVLKVALEFGDRVRNAKRNLGCIVEDKWVINGR